MKRGSARPPAGISMIQWTYRATLARKASNDTNSPAIAPASLERVLTCPLVAFLAAVLLVVGYGLVTGNPRDRKSVV